MLTVNAKVPLLPVLALLIFVYDNAHGQESWWVGDTAYTVVPSAAKVAVQFTDELGPLEAGTFASSHTFLVDSIPPEPLGRGFTIYSIDTAVGFASARAELSTDAAVSRVFPVYYLLPDIGEVPTTDLISVQFYPEISSQVALSVLSSLELSLVDTVTYAHNFWCCAIPETASSGPLEYAEQLNAHEATEWAVPTSFLKPVLQSLPTDEYFQYQYYLHNTGQVGLADVDIDADSAWMIPLADQYLTVAIIDNGVMAHPDISAERLLEGWDFVGENFMDTQYPGDPNTTPTTEKTHGMALAGILAGEHNDEGIVGVYKSGYILPVKIADDQGEPTRSSVIIAKAFRWAAIYGARVIVSGLTFESKYRDTAISNAMWDVALCGDGDLGSVVVFPAGNAADQDNPDIDGQWPAGNENVLAIGAVSKWGERWNYSCFGHELDFMAPSGEDADFSWEPGDIWTVDRVGTDGYNPRHNGAGDANGDLDYTSRFGGTSAAAPQVAGVAALILAKRPDFAQLCKPLDSIYSVLRHSADDIPPAGFDTLTGWGRINAFRALLSVSHGDVNNDGAVNVQDVVTVTDIAFRGGNPFDTAKVWHPALADLNCDGILCNVQDVVFTVNVAFRGSQQPVCYRFNY